MQARCKASEEGEGGGRLVPEGKRGGEGKRTRGVEGKKRMKGMGGKGWFQRGRGQREKVRGRADSKGEGERKRLQRGERRREKGRGRG